MNRKAAAIFAIAILTLFPSTSKADLDVLSIAQDQITSLTGKVNEVVKKYTNMQFNLQELSLNRNIVSELKDKVKKELKANAMQFYGDMKDLAEAEGMAFLKSSLSSVSLPGIGQYVDMGAFVNPKLKVEVGKQYLKKQHKNNDVQYVAAQDERNNNMMVDNTAILFANSLVRRKQIIEEDPCRCVDDKDKLISGMPNCDNQSVEACKEKKEKLSEMKDVNVVKNNYYTTVLEAHHRWLKIKEAMAAYSKMKDESELNQGNIDDISAITGEIEEEKEEAGNQAVLELMQKKINPLDLTASIKSGIDDIKNGNYTGALAGALGTTADIYGNAPGSWQSVTTALQDATIGVKALDNAYHNAQSGNWGGVLGAAAEGTGGILSNSGSQNLGNIFSNSASGAGNALNSALSGDWGSAISNAEQSAGSAISGSGNEVLGSMISAGGNLTDAGIDIANSGGNLSDIVDNALSNGQAQGALSSLQGAYDNKIAADKQREDAQKALQEEQAQKLQNSLAQANEELKKQKQAECKKCNDENEALMKAGQPLKSCISVCM